MLLATLETLHKLNTTVKFSDHSAANGTFYRLLSFKQLSPGISSKRRGKPPSPPSDHRLFTHVRLQQQCRCSAPSFSPLSFIRQKSPSLRTPLIHHQSLFSPLKHFIPRLYLLSHATCPNPLTLTMQHPVRKNSYNKSRF